MRSGRTRIKKPKTGTLIDHDIENKNAESEILLRRTYFYDRKEENLQSITTDNIDRISFVCRR